ncbi:hypothetical protein XM57_14755 [Burkholderia cepacia]|nr:hypothetical protein XM57_14755 [Burkholderia cepacia]
MAIHRCDARTRAHADTDDAHAHAHADTHDADACTDTDAERTSDRPEVLLGCPGKYHRLRRRHEHGAMEQNRTCVDRRQGGDADFIAGG